MKKFWKMLTSNMLLKLLAFCFACLIYAILNDGSVVTQNIPRVPVNFTVPDTLCAPEGHYEVSLQLKGSRNEIRKLKSSRLSGQIKLAADLKTGRHEIVLSGDDFNLADVEVVKIVPSALEVPIQRRISRILPVKPQITGTPADGYRVGEIKVWPENVLITGAETALETMQKIKTAPISVKGENSDFGKENVELQTLAKGVVARPASVSVNVQIRKRLHRNRILKKVPVHYLHRFAFGSNRGKNLLFASDPRFVDVEVSGSDGEVSQLAADDLLLFVNLTAVEAEQSGELVRPVEWMPVRDFPAVKVVRSIPAEIKVKYTVGGSFMLRH